MIIEVPVFNTINIKKFQGIQEKQLSIQPGISTILFNPCSGKSSFLNSVVFLYTGDLRQLDNYSYFYTLRYDEVVGVVFNNSITSVENLEISNDYLTVTGTTDLSILSESDRSTVDDYVVKIVFKRTVDTEKLKNFIPEVNTENKPCNSFTTVDYSYLCYDEDKFCFESRFQDVSKLFTNQSVTVTTEEIYKYVKKIISELFNLDVFISSSQLAVSKNGRVVYTPPTTISLLVLLIIHILNPTSSVIFVDDFVSKFDDEKRTKIISYLTELLYSTNSVKKVVFIGNNSESDKWRKLISSENITIF